jgi:tetratricopeptide (TPR) repeat protein
MAAEFATEKMLTVYCMMVVEIPSCLDVRVRLLNEIVSLPPDPWWAEAHVELAEYEESLGNYEGALTHIEHAKSPDAGATAVCMAHALILYATLQEDTPQQLNRNELAAAIALLEERKAPVTSRGLDLLAYLYLNDQQVDAGRKCIERGFRLRQDRQLDHVENAFSWIIVARFEYQAKDFKRCREAVENGLRLLPSPQHGIAAVRRLELENLKTKLGE